jgi:integrase
MRDTFKERAKAYLAACKGHYSEGTLARIGRNLETIRKDLRNLHESNLRADGLSPTRPRAVAPTAIREEHVSGLLLVWHGRGLQPAAQRKYLSDLEGYLVWTGNTTLDAMRRMRHVHLPKAVEEEPESLDEDELAQLRAAAAGWDGWRGQVARLLVGLLPESGLRPKEVRLARLADVNLRKQRIRVSAPKGEGSWASRNRDVPVTAAGRAALADFLPEREAYLEGTRCEWLIPLWTEPQPYARAVGPWSDQTMRKLAADLRERSGVRFSWKTLRATFGQRLVDRGLPLEQTSVAMRHKKVETTRRYYVRLDQERALAAARRALDGPVERPD